MDAHVGRRVEHTSPLVVVEVRLPGGAVVHVQTGPEHEGEAVVSLAEQVGLGALGVDAEAVVDGDVAGRHLGLLAPHINGHDVRRDGLVLVVHPEALRHAGREALAPLANFGGLGEHCLVPLGLQHRHAVVELVLARGPGELVDDDLVDRTDLAGVHNPPCRSGLGQQTLLQRDGRGPGLVEDLLGVGEEVLADAFVVVLGEVLRGDVAEAVTEVHFRARHAVLEADHIAADNRGLHLVDGDRAGTAVLDALFTQPLQLHRLADALRDLRRVDVLVVEQVATEGATGRDHVVRDVLDLDAQRLGHLALHDARHLGAAPTLVLPVLEHAAGAVLLHRGVRDVRPPEGALDALAGRRDGVDDPVEVVVDLSVGQLVHRACAPLDLERVLGLLGDTEGLGRHGHGLGDQVVGHTRDVGNGDDALHGLGRGVVDRHHRRTVRRRHGHNRREELLGREQVHGVRRGAPDDLGQVPPDLGLPDDLEVLGRLRSSRRGLREARSQLGQLAK